MAIGYVVYMGKGDPVGDTIKVPLRPHADLASAQAAAGDHSRVFEVNVENPDETGKGTCTIIKQIDGNIEEGLRAWPDMTFDDTEDAQSALDWHDRHAKIHAGKMKSEPGRRTSHADFVNIHKRKAKAAKEWLAKNGAAKEPMKEDANAEHYHGLTGWVSDYKAQRKAGNVADAKQTRDNIKAVIKKHNLDATKVWGEDPDQPKEPMKESKAVSGLAFLVESELEKAQVVIAAKGILDKLQKMAEDLAKTEADDIMPMLDSMRLTFGPELTDSFNDITTAKIRQTMEAVKGAKEAITREVGRLENEVNGDMTNDIGMGDQDNGEDMDAGDMGAEAPEGELNMGDDNMPPMDGAEAPMPGDDEEVPDPAADGGLDAAFDDAAADTTAAGRAKKESVQRNVKALSESKNPDRLVFETFRRTLKESKDAVRAAQAVAQAFAIDFADVVAIVKEGKTFKDEKGKTDKNKDRAEDRKEKKRNRPSDLDEDFGDNKAPPFGKKADKDEGEDKKDDKADKKPAASKKPWEKDDEKVEEGKTFKDEKGKTDKNKDRSGERKDKKREREELGEGSKRPFDSASPPDVHQKKIALKTLKMSDVGADVMGGMSKVEARSFLKNRCGYSDARIAKLEEGAIMNIGEATIEQLQRREEDLARAAAARRAKGFGAMADAKEKQKPAEKK
jgi:hypothetical protein